MEARLHCVIGLVVGACSGTPASSREWWHGAPSEGGTSVTLEVVGALRLRPVTEQRLPPSLDTGGTM